MGSRLRRDHAQRGLGRLHGSTADLTSSLRRPFRLRAAGVGLYRVASPHFPDYEPTVPAFLAQVTKRFGASPMIVQRRAAPPATERPRSARRLARGLLATGVGKGTASASCRTGPTGSSRGSRRRASARSRCRSTRSTRRASSPTCCDTRTCRRSSRTTTSSSTTTSRGSRPPRPGSPAQTAARRSGSRAAVPAPGPRSGDGGERWARAGRGARGRRRAQPRDRRRFLAAVEARSRPPTRCHRLQLGQHRRAEGRRPQPRHGGPARARPERVPRPAARRPDLLADAVFLGGRVRLLAARPDARRRVPPLRGCLRARAHARPARAERATVVARLAAFAKAMAEHPSFATRDLSAVRARQSLRTCSPSPARRIRSSARTPSA